METENHCLVTLQTVHNVNRKPCFTNCESNFWGRKIRSKLDYRLNFGLQQCSPEVFVCKLCSAKCVACSLPIRLRCELIWMPELDAIKSRVAFIVTLRYAVRRCDNHLRIPPDPFGSRLCCPCAMYCTVVHCRSPAFTSESLVVMVWWCVPSFSVPVEHRKATIQKVIRSIKGSCLA